MTLRRFKVILERESEGGFSAYVPSLPGCASQGETLEETKRNIQEAIQCHLESLLEDGQPVPTERGVCHG